MPSRSCSADVLVVGAGVIGLSTALALRQAGLRVTVFEARAVGRGAASWAGGGILSPLEPAAVDAGDLPLLRDSLARYGPWCEALRASSGVDPEYWRSGLRVLAPSDAPGWTALARQCGWTARTDAPSDSLLLEGVAQVRSPRLLRALAAALVAAGGELREHDPVEGLRADGDRVVGLRSASGEHAGGIVVLAAGAWSARLDGDCAVQPVRGQMLLLPASPGELDAIVLRQGDYLIPRRDGLVVAGSTLEHVGYDDQPTAGGRAHILARVARMAPALAQRTVLAHWSGLRPALARPRIGWSERRRGLFLNLGHYRLGITLAPGSAHEVRRQILSAA